MCFARKVGLGQYNATRREWVKAYRYARIKASQGLQPDQANDGAIWKAELIVSERTHIDPLTITGVSRLAASRIIDEILSEQ